MKLIKYKISYEWTEIQNAFFSKTSILSLCLYMWLISREYKELLSPFSSQIQHTRRHLINKHSFIVELYKIYLFEQIKMVARWKDKINYYNLFFVDKFVFVIFIICNLQPVTTIRNCYFWSTHSVWSSLYSVIIGDEKKYKHRWRWPKVSTTTEGAPISHYKWSMD